MDVGEEHSGIETNNNNEDEMEDDNENENQQESLFDENVKLTKKRSNVWDHYNEIVVNGSKYGKCKYCPKKFKISGKANGSTGNMKKHSLKHPDLIRLEIVDDENSVSVFSQENFRKSLLKWVVMSDQAFTAPQQQSFVDMVHILNPEAKLYCDKTIRADLLATHTEKVDDVKVRVSQIPGKLSITMDGWTSKNMLPFLGIRAHWLDEQWTYQTQLLDFSYIEGSHSGENFKDIFLVALSRLGIPLEKILSITVDNATSNDTFFEELEAYGISANEHHVRCLAHVINLAAQDILAHLKVPADNLDHPDEDDLESEVLDDIDLNDEIVVDVDTDSDEDSEQDSEMNTDDQIIVIKLRILVRKIRKSVQMRQKLKKFCGIYQIKYLVPILDVSTRWNSTYDMIVRAEYLQIPLRALCSNEKSLTSFHITGGQWLELYEVKHLLGKFHRATQLISMERHATIHAYLPTLDWLILSLQSTANGSSALAEAARMGLLKLKKYHEIVYETKIPFIATFLNPALKLNYFKEHNYSNLKIRQIKTMISKYFSDNYETSTAASEDEVDSDADDLYKHMFKRSKIDNISSEIQKYLNLPLANKKVNTLDYWKSKNVQDEFPKFTKMAQDFLPIQSTSVPMERDFSKGTQTVRPTRCSLIAETIEASMFLKSWFKSFDSKPIHQ